MSPPAASARPTWLRRVDVRWKRIRLTGAIDFFFFRERERNWLHGKHFNLFVNHANGTRKPIGKSYRPCKLDDDARRISKRSRSRRQNGKSSIKNEAGREAYKSYWQARKEINVTNATKWFWQKTATIRKLSTMYNKK